MQHEKSSGRGSRWADDKEPETDSHEVVGQIVAKIMLKNQERIKAK